MITKETLAFLTGLAANNDRNWFEAHRAAYEAARKNALAFAGEVIRGIAAFDETVPPALEPKDCMMRIYRDIRFSKDKTPYKTNFGIAISANGKNFDGPGYYVHIEPGKAFIGGGSWMPEAGQLKMIRQEIDYNGGELKNILASPAFAKTYGALSEEDKLKTVPKGYTADHELIELLKLKSFTVSASVTDKMLISSGSATRIVEMFETLHPFIVYLRGAIS